MILYIGVETNPVKLKKKRAALLRIDELPGEIVDCPLQDLKLSAGISIIDRP